MPAMDTEAVFLPYVNAGESLRLSLTSTAADGKDQPSVLGSDNASLDLSGIGEWTEIRLTFKVEVDQGTPAVTDLLPPGESLAPPVALLASLHCSSTYRRWGSIGTWDHTTQSGHLEFLLKRDNLADAVELNVLLTRTTAQTADPLLAMDTQARLAWSRQWRIHLTPGAQKRGTGLDTRWENFKQSESTWRRNHAGLLLHLDTTPEQPRLYLNSAVDQDLQTVLKEEAPRGKKAAIRDLVYSAISLSVWSSLVQHARQGLSSEAVPAGWQRNVLLSVARQVSPGLSDDAALHELVDDLRDANGGRGIEERVAAAILELSKLRVQAEQSVRDLQ